MLVVHRTRQLLIAACVGAIVLVAVEFPLHNLLQQRSEIAAVASQLATVQQHNDALKSAIKSLSEPAQIAAIAHQEYGLVEPGQRSYVILPSASSKTSDPIGPSTIPTEDLGATGTANTTGGEATSSVHSAGLWSRFLTRLEFWR